MQGREPQSGFRALGSGCWQRKQQPQSASGDQGTVGRDHGQVGWAWSTPAARQRRSPGGLWGQRLPVSAGCHVWVPRTGFWASEVGTLRQAHGASLRGAGSGDRGGELMPWAPGGESGWGRGAGPQPPRRSRLPPPEHSAARERRVYAPRSPRNCWTEAVRAPLWAAPCCWVALQILLAQSCPTLHPVDLQQPRPPWLLLSRLAQTHVH